ncbi:nicotinate-nucleotide--dimethylbenzimidazole phosphoribosyltransferase [Streptomyces sp. NPDC018693]|uniref:nicotinate-nucleotide--dimethylbenzimidazole phosphoribosyltransferase n=1 Tax=unclassified Streptomyces TaxID=2593676 RepID=UPI00378FC267
MTDTGQVPGEGLPENAGTVEQPGVQAPGAYAYVSETTAEDEDLLLPGSGGAWGNEVAPPAPEPVVEAVHQPAHEPGPHEMSGRDSGSVDLSAVRLPGPTSATPPTAPTIPIPPTTPRRPLHLGPPIPNASASPVRSLADRGPAGVPARQPGPPTTGPEYLDVPPTRDATPQGAAPWGAQGAVASGAVPPAGAASGAGAAVTAGAVAPGAVAAGPVAAGATAAETVGPAVGAVQEQPEPVGAAQAVVARVATEAIAATAPQGAETAQSQDGEGTVPVAEQAPEGAQVSGVPVEASGQGQGADPSADGAVAEVAQGIDPSADGAVADAAEGSTPTADAAQTDAMAVPTPESGQGPEAVAQPPAAETGVPEAGTPGAVDDVQVTEGVAEDAVHAAGDVAAGGEEVAQTVAAEGARAAAAEDVHAVVAGAAQADVTQDAVGTLGEGAQAAPAEGAQATAADGAQAVVVDGAQAVAAGAGQAAAAEGAQAIGADGAQAVVVDGAQAVAAGAGQAAAAEDAQADVGESAQAAVAQDAQAPHDAVADAMQTPEADGAPTAEGIAADAAAQDPEAAVAEAAQTPEDVAPEAMPADPDAQAPDIAGAAAPAAPDASAAAAPDAPAAPDASAAAAPAAPAAATADGATTAEAAVAPELTAAGVAPTAHATPAEHSQAPAAGTAEAAAPAAPEAPVVAETAQPSAPGAPVAGAPAPANAAAVSAAGGPEAVASEAPTAAVSAASVTQEAPMAAVDAQAAAAGDPEAATPATAAAPTTAEAPAANAPEAAVAAAATPAVAHAPAVDAPQAADALAPAAVTPATPKAPAPVEAPTPAPAAPAEEPSAPESTAEEAATAPQPGDATAPPTAAPADAQDAQAPAVAPPADTSVAPEPQPDATVPQAETPDPAAVQEADPTSHNPNTTTPTPDPAAAAHPEHTAPTPQQPQAPTAEPLAAQTPPAAAPDAPDPVAPEQHPAGPVHLPTGGAPQGTGVPMEPRPDQPLGQFVPVEGTVPTTPHLAPTPPHPLAVPPDAPQGPVATVPAPRAADPASAPATPDAEPDPEIAQSPEDLETRAADHDEESRAAVEEVRESTGPAAPPYDDAEREAVLKVMRERRDIRNGFRSDPIPHEVLLRVLEAAHTAPSVGHSQPWDFVVIRSADTRRTMHELAMRQREAYAKSLPKGRAKQFKELKIEAILDTPVNIVVTADPTRGGRHTLGRHTQPQMAPYSAALAVENLWLAARAEGLGVGWVSFFDEREMVRSLGLPEHLEVIAYLCVGYVDEFPDEPELMQAGWSKRRPLSWVVHEETYGRRALPGEEPHDLLAETVAQIRPLDAKALGEAWERQKRMTKPAGALGMLEIISAQLSGLSRQCPPPIPEPAAVAIFAGDHGVHAQGVTPWPQEVTAQMVANFLGGGAVCNAFAAQVGAEVCVVDVGVAADLPATPGLLPRKIRAGTSDMTTGPAMTREEAKQAIEVGIETARDLVAAGNKALLTGEMGIANTTASAALISVFTGADPSEVTGRGTGINDETLARKTEVVRRALEVHQPDPADPIGVLAAIGGFEHAAMVGLLLGGASLRTPVILDGVSAGAAALVARAIAPEVLAACIAGHRSAEPGHVAALNKLGLRPLVDLDLRLGEGTGALLALPLVQSTARAMHEVATFDSAGVTEK